MVRKVSLASAVALVLTAGSANAQQARNSPDQIVCAITNSCGTAGAPSADQQIAVGDERAFSLARPAGRAPAAAPAPAARPRGAAPVRRTAAAATRRAAPAPAVRSGNGLDMLVTFPSGSAQMTPQARAEARAFATAMQTPQLAGMRFGIEGHTDAVGNRAYNLDLSRRRAQSVVDYLVTQGIDRSRLEAAGYGFDKPKDGLTPRAAGNRRVEFVRRT